MPKPLSGQGPRAALPPGAVKRKVKPAKKKDAPDTKAKHEVSDSEASEYDSSIEDTPESDVEDAEDYKKGGYHPVHVGERYNNGRYTVLTKLGWGHFSTVWLVINNVTQEYGAMKVQKSAKHYTEAALDEVTLLKQIRDGDEHNTKHCCRLLDSFEHHGPNGKHICMVFEVLGDNLLALIKSYNYEGIPIPVVRNLARQMLIALDYLHRELQIIHTDLKPENVMLVRPLKDRTWELPDLTHTHTQPAQPPLTQPPRPPSPPTHPLTSPRDTTNTQPASNGAAAADRSQPLALPPAPADSAGGASAQLSRNQKKKAKRKAKKKAAAAAASGAGDEGVGSDADSDDNGGDSVATSSLQQTTTTSQSQPVVQQQPHVLDLASGHNHSQYSEAQSQLQVQPHTAQGHANGGLQGGGVATLAVHSNGSNGLVPVNGSVQPPTTVFTVPGLTETELPTAQARIVDFGNGCWTYKQFTTDIQTRQYRCPEVILGAKYSTPCDMWSLACMLFELVTGDLLFDPRSGRDYSRDEDHLAQMIELLGRMPRRVSEKGKFTQEFFNRHGELRHIKKLRFWSLDNVLEEKYRVPRHEAEGLASFLLPMLEYVPEKRATAAEMLKHPWLHGVLPRPPRGSHEGGAARGSGGGERQRRDSSGGRDGHHRSPSPSRHHQHQGPSKRYRSGFY